MATFIVNKCPLKDELKLRNEMSVDDCEVVAGSCSPSLPLFALLNGAKLRERKDERPPPSKEYLAKIEKLKAREEERRWHEETRSLQSGGLRGQHSFGQEMRAANRQLTVILNMILTVAATFVFGFVGLQYTHPGLTQEVRLFIGLIMATIVFFADIYFVIKSLDQDLAP